MDMFLSLFIRLDPIQPIGRNKIGIPAAQSGSLFIHHCREPFHAASYMLCYHHSRVIIGFQHQGIQQVLQPVLLSFPHPQVHLGLGSGIGRRLHRILPPSILQSQDTGHNFGGTGHGPDNILSLPIQYSACIPIHKDSRLGIQLQEIPIFPYLFCRRYRSPTVCRRIHLCADQ